MSAPVLVVAALMPTMDFELYSEAGFVWNEPGTDPKKPLGFWSSLPSAPQGKKGLPIVGAAVYAEHPSTEILTLSYDLCDGEGVRRWKPGEPLPQDLFDHLAAGHPIEAHNAMFERLMWERVAVPKYGFPPLDPYLLRCSMATARVNNLPGALGNLGDVLNVETKKDKDGKRLLDKFSIPRNPTKLDGRRRVTPQDDPADAERLYSYCDDDVRAEQGSAQRMEPMSADELRFWLIDQEINHRGLGVDRQGIRDCIAVLNEALEHYGEECRRLTGGIEAGQLAELRGWMAGQGVTLPDMQSDTVELYLKRADGVPPTAERAAVAPLPRNVKRVLEIRSLIGSASVKKLHAMEFQTSADNRLRNLIVHHGARTGRPTGEGPQPLNLPKAGPKLVWCLPCGKPYAPKGAPCPWCHAPFFMRKLSRDGGYAKPAWQADMVAPVLEIMSARSLGLVEYFFGDALLAIQGCVRGLFQADEGHELIASDYSAIEAVVAAMISGESWREETLRARKDIYLASASKITGLTYEAYVAYSDEHGEHHPDRQNIGKVAELALGYGGWSGAWRAFDPAEASKTDGEIEGVIRAWRDASPQIVAHWGGQRYRNPNGYGWVNDLYGIEGAVIQAIQCPGQYFLPQPPPGIKPFPVEIGFYVHNDILRMRLPSGREIKYWNPQVAPSSRRPGSLEISYMTWNSNPKYGALGWVRMATWGSRIYENADQAIAHDILRYAIENLRIAGYPTVLHVYDEIVVEVAAGAGSVEQVETIMATMPPWAAGWPVRASGGWRGRRYRKG